MANPKGKPENLKPPWKLGNSGNPKGRPLVDQNLKELREKNGDWPRMELMQLARDKRIKPETRARILMHLDDKFTGKAPQHTAADVTPGFVSPDPEIPMDEWKRLYCCTTVPYDGEEADEHKQSGYQ